MAKRKRKKRMDDVVGMVGTGVGLSVGASVLGSVGGVPSTYAATGIGRMAKAMPTIGTIKGAEWTIEEVKGVARLARKKRRKRKSRKKKR